MPEGRICLGCGSLVVGMTAQRCAPCERAADVQRVEERRAYGRAMKDTGPRARRRRKVYQSPEWKAIRLRVIARDGACRLCGSTARLTVHHLTPAADDGAAALDMDNLVTLCAPCHGRIDGPKAARAKARARARRRRMPRAIGNGGA
jgi:5-methylcytosine-specific restriction protein A